MSNLTLELLNVFNLIKSKKKFKEMLVKELESKSWFVKYSDQNKYEKHKNNFPNNTQMVYIYQYMLD